MNVLPPDSEHPPRPDVPVVRHITFTEIHAAQLGGYIGAFVFAGVVFGASHIAFPVLAAAIHRIISDKRANSGSTCAEHPMGLHDARMEPHYFGGGASIAYVVLWVILA